MKWLFIFILLIPIVNADCGNLSISAEQDDFFFILTFNASSSPIEYWIEDAFGEIIMPKRLTTQQKVTFIFNTTETWLYPKARLLKCKSQVTTQLRITKPEIFTYKSPIKKLFSFFPWIFLGLLLPAFLALLWSR